MLDVLKTINTNLPAMSKGHRRIATVIIEGSTPSLSYRSKANSPSKSVMIRYPPFR